MENKIPQILHFVWVGDESKLPEKCISTWENQNKNCKVKIWGNDEYENMEWVTKRHMQSFWRNGELCGVADLMRWEILYNYGGIAIDADTVCLRPFEDWFFDCNLFACYENEVLIPSQVSNGVVGSVKNNVLVDFIIKKINKENDIARKFIWYKLRTKKMRAWKTTGPKALTNALVESKYFDATILPSHFFIPNHYSGACYSGGGPVYCKQLWGSTKDIYGVI